MEIEGFLKDKQEKDKQDFFKRTTENEEEREMESRSQKPFHGRCIPKTKDVQRHKKPNESDKIEDNKDEQE